jgi:hypothetical protein
MQTSNPPPVAADLSAGPSNRFLIRERDRRWPRALSVALSVSACLLVLLLLIGWPRLKCTLIHYELVRLRAEVLELERRHDALTIDLEHERCPRRLADRAAALGLVPLSSIPPVATRQTTAPP